MEFRGGGAGNKSEGTDARYVGQEQPLEAVVVRDIEKDVSLLNLNARLWPFRFRGGVSRDGITPAALSYTRDSSSGLSAAMALVPGVGRLIDLGVSTENPVRVPLRDLD